MHQLLAALRQERPHTGVSALEIVNEPDYLWMPEEMKIESCGYLLLGPIWKYVTELHSRRSLPSIDPRAVRGDAVRGLVQAGAWFDYVAAGAADAGAEFDWGPRFDWYVRCFAQLEADVSRAIKDEARAVGSRW